MIGSRFTSPIAASLMVAAIGITQPAGAQGVATDKDPATTPVLAASSPAGATSSLPAGDPDLAKGRRAFQRNCTVCHGLSGEGGLGPPLKGIAARLSADEITRQLKTPRGSMPRLYPSPIDDRLLVDLRAYLLQLR